MVSSHGRPVSTVALALALSVALVLAAFPAIAAAGDQTPGGAEGVQGTPYFNPCSIEGFEYLDGPDSAEKDRFLAEHPRVKEFFDRVEAMREELPADKLPASLRPKTGAPVAGTNDSGEPRGGGTGGWTPIMQSNTVYPAPNNDSVARPWNCVFDTNGAMHLVFQQGSVDNVSPGGPYQRYSLFHTMFVAGKWTEPKEIGPVSGEQTNNIMAILPDPDGNLHVVYENDEWTTVPPPGTRKDLAKGNIMYTYRSPDGIWSNPRQLTAFSGFNMVMGAQILLVGGRIHIAWVELETIWSAQNDFIQQLCATDGMKDDWRNGGAGNVLATYTFNDLGGTESIEWGSLFASAAAVNGELTVAYATRTTQLTNPPPPLCYDHLYSVRAAIRGADGEWKGPDVIAGPTVNKAWWMEQVIYGQKSSTCRVVVRQHERFDRFWDPVNLNYFGQRADFPPAENLFALQHDTEWRQIQISDAASRQDVMFYFIFNGAAIFADPISGEWRVPYRILNSRWNGTNWMQESSVLNFASESVGGFRNDYVAGGPEADKYVVNANPTMDRNGNVHILYTMANYDATGGYFYWYKLYYTNNGPETSGAGFAAPTQLNGSDNQVQEPLLVTDPALGVLALWEESKDKEFVVAPGPPPVVQTRTVLDDIHSRYKSDKEWGDDRVINAGLGMVYDPVDPESWVFNVTPFGDVQLLFKTNAFDENALQYYNDRFYFATSQGGSWLAPELITGESSFAGTVGLLASDLNNRSFALFDGPGTMYATNQKLPTPPVATYYFGEGTTRDFQQFGITNRFDEWICIQNPGEKEANVTLTYMLGTGQNKEQKVTVAPHSRFTVDVNLAVGKDQDVSTRVTSDRLVVVERPMYFDYWPGGWQGTQGWTGGHDVIGSMNTGRLWYLAEGTTRTAPSAFNEYITIQNPTGTDTTVNVTYMLETGETRNQAVSVPGRSRATVDVNAAVGANHDVSAMLESSHAVIVVERPMYFNYTPDGGKSAWDGGHDVMGSTGLFNRMYFAEGTTRAGFDTYLCIQNPNTEKAGIAVTYILGDGTSKTEQVEVDKTTRRTIKVNDVVGADKDVSILVDSSVPILAERPMYFKYRDKWTGGHVQTGASFPKNSWFFAEGTTRDNKTDGQFEEWLSIQNPNDSDANVSFSYMLGDGSVVQKSMVVGKNSRATVDVNLALGKDKDVSVAVWSDKGIIVERPMYFNYRDAWTGGHDVMGL